jgi:hypothetical protein
MTMADKIDDPAEMPMSLWSRVLMGVTGLGLCVAGLIAVFIKETNVAGVPLLIVAGAAFIYVALTGQRLIQVSKDGVTFGKVARLEKTLREAGADPEIPYDSKERLADIAEDNGIRLTRPSEFELVIEVREMFRRLGEQHGFDVAIRMGAHDVGTDFVLTNQAGITLAVEVKGRIRVRQFSEAVRALRATSWDLKMLVIDSSLPDEFSGQLEGVSVIGWAPDSEARFVAKLRQLGFIRG